MKTLLRSFSIIGNILGFLLPILLGLIGGFNEKSFSRYYFTDAKLVFIVSLTIIAISFVTINRKWIVPSISLLLITYFNCTDYALIHNLSALIFFVHSTFLIHTDKRFKWISYCILASLPLLIFSIYYFELVSVLLISYFHFQYLRLMSNYK